MSEINPSVPQEQPTQNQTETKPLTLEQIEQKVLDETLKLSWLTWDDLQKFYKDCTSCNLKILKEELQTTPEEKLIEKKAQELYQEYLEKNSKEWNIREVVNLDALTKSIDSPRLEEMKNLIEKVLDEALKKYDFLDTQSKELVKIGLINSMIKSPMAEIGDSLIGGVWKFIHTLSTLDGSDIENLSKKLNNLNPKDSGRVLSLEEEFGKKLGNYTNKFEEIQKKFEENKITDLTQKQNIISHIDWFRNPALIEAGVDGLDVSKIDYSKISKNETPLDAKAISEYMGNSREKILDISKKLNLWDKSADTVYNLIENGGVVGSWVEKILEVLLKIPFLWKFLAIFLGLNPDPEKALSELKENASNFKLVSALKWLWISKNDQWEEIPWKKPFEKIDLSDIRFNIVKNEIKEVKAIFGETKDEDLAGKWEKAFTQWIEKDGITIKFDLWSAWNDKKITSSELKEILKKGLWEFNWKKEENKTKAETEKREKDQKENQEKIANLSATKDTLDSQIKNISSIIHKDYEKVRHWDDVFNVWDINDIKTQDIINHNGSDFNTLIETNLKTGNLNDLSREDLALINTLFSFMKEYCKEKSLSNQWEIKDFLKNNETGFHTWLNTKKTELEKQRDGKQNELATLEWNQEKLHFAKSVWEKIKNAPDNSSLLWNWIDLWENKKLSFNKDSQELNIWNEKFKIELTSKWEKYNLKDIKITDGKVEFVPDIEDFKLVAARAKDSELWFTSKEKIINWITDLVTKWNFTHEKDKTKLSFSKVVA